MQFYRKLRGEVINRELDAYKERRAAGLFKPIEKRKIESRVKDYVRDSIRRWREKGPG